MSLGKIDVTAALANVEKTLREDKSSSPQVRAMMELLVCWHAFENAFF